MSFLELAITPPKNNTTLFKEIYRKARLPSNQLIINTAGVTARCAENIAFRRRKELVTLQKDVDTAWAKYKLYKRRLETII